jgi:hypothetical protein
LTGDENPIYPESTLEPTTNSAESGSQSVENITADFFFVPPDILPSFFYEPGVIDNYDPAIQEIVPYQAPEIIEDYNPGKDND